MILTLSVGALLRILFKWSKLSYAIGAVVSVLSIVLLFNLAFAFVKQDKLSYNEYWNGYELQADHLVYTCTRDGPCIHGYNCDPYEVIHYTYDSKGNITGSYTTTEYHHCPYTTEEWKFVVKTTLGDYEIAGHNLPNDPSNHQWRPSHDIPGDIPVGIPPFWQAARNRLDAKKPGPVTKRMQYDNYILASDETILNQYSDKIEEFKANNILPGPAKDVRDFYYADKVYSVGFSNGAGFSDSLSYLNAALGTELQGDLHLVIAQNSIISAQPDAYITALKAYWTSKEFGDNTISKNSLIVLLGTDDGKTISYARAITGMPLGNEYLLQKIQSLVGTQLTPEVVLGQSNGEIYVRDDGKTKVRAVHGKGALERLLWGLDDPATLFKRVSMTANDAEDVGTGFGYLSDQIQPSESQQFWISLIVGLLSTLVVWGSVYYYGLESEDKYELYNRRRNSWR